MDRLLDGWMYEPIDGRLVGWMTTTKQTLPQIIHKTICTSRKRTDGHTYDSLLVCVYRIWDKNNNNHKTKTVALFTDLKLTINQPNISSQIPLEEPPKMHIPSITKTHTSQQQQQLLLGGTLKQWKQNKLRKEMFPNDQMYSHQRRTRKRNIHSPAIPSQLTRDGRTDGRTILAG